MKKTLFTLGLCALFMVGCTGNKNSNTESTDTVEVENVEVQPAVGAGEYEGTLPCADCPGIKTTLVLNKDYTYTLTQEYLEKEDGKFEQKGTFAYLENGKTIELTSDNNEKTHYNVYPDAGTVVLADATGAETEGDLANQYVLTKK